MLREAWEAGIRQGVQDGLFALGEKVGGKLVPCYFKITPLEVTLGNDEVIIQSNLIKESITPEDILRDYLTENETISTSQPFQYDSQSSSEPRTLLDAWEAAIREGVKKGTFGIGDKIGDEIALRAFRQDPLTIALGDNEVLIHASLCTQLIVEPPRSDPSDSGESPENGEGVDPLSNESPKKTIGIRFTLPQGKVSNVAQLLNQLQSKFQNMQLELKASNGEISQGAYEELKDNLRALGIEIEEV